MFTPSESRLKCCFEHILDWKLGKTDEKMGIHGVPLSRLLGFLVCRDYGLIKKGGALASIAAPSMSCEEGFASDKSRRKESEQNKGNSRPSIYDASVSFCGDNPPHGKLQEILVAEGGRFGLSGGFEPPTVFRTAAISRSASPTVECAERI